MDQVIELLTRLLPVGQLSEAQITTALAEAGWPATGPTAAAPHPRTWRNDAVDAWLPETDNLQVEFILWEREVEEDWGDEGLDPVYDEATGVVQNFARRVENSELAPHLGVFQGDATDGVDYIDHTAWHLGAMTFLLGAKQDDTELPVVVVAVLSRQPELG
jgi:hypothetical protein